MPKGGSGSHSWDWWTGTSGAPICRENGIQNCCYIPGAEKETLAYQLGAHKYIDTYAGDAAKELKKMGGAQLIIGTAPNGKAISEVFGGLCRNGQLIIVAASRDMLQIHPGQLLEAAPSAVRLAGISRKPSISVFFSR